MTSTVRDKVRAMWTTATIKGHLLAGDPALLKAWRGKKPITKGQWFLHYWGHPATSYLPRPLAPNGSVGHQYLFCDSDDEVRIQYAAIIAALRTKAPKLKVHGPAPENAKLVSLLSKKHVGIEIPKTVGLTISLERATDTLLAEAVMAGNNDEPRFAHVFPPTKGFVAEMSGLVHATVDGKDLVLVACGKGEAKTLLPAALARKGITESAYETVKLGKQLALTGTRESGVVAATLPCTAGSYRIVECETEDAYMHLRLRRS
jgi:hypothetical protein